MNVLPVAPIIIIKNDFQCPSLQPIWALAYALESSEVDSMIRATFRGLPRPRFGTGTEWCDESESGCDCGCAGISIASFFEGDSASSSRTFGGRPRFRRIATASTLTTFFSWNVFGMSSSPKISSFLWEIFQITATRCSSGGGRC